jgi:hypothetical protein
VDCRDQQLEKFQTPPSTVYGLKGGQPLVCCPSDRVTPPGIADYRICTEEEISDYYDNYYYSEYGSDFDLPCKLPVDSAPKYVYQYNTPEQCKNGTTCTNGNSCGSKDFEKATPPKACGFDKATGEDKFCCKDLNQNSERVLEPQKPLFTDKKTGNAYPCMDHTRHCERWIIESPRSCNPRHNNTNGFSSYPFMREVCQETCTKKEKEKFRSNKCEKGCVDEYENCPLWSRLGLCHGRPQFMYFHCRESCGTCGFKSALNTELQVVDDQQYTDTSANNFMCGSNRKKKPVDEETLKMIQANQAKRDENYGICTSFLISDRFALTAAHCQESYEQR